MPFSPSPGERTLSEARTEGFTVWVTNRRLVAEQGGTGGESLTFLPLEKVDHMEHRLTSNPFWVRVGAALGLFGLIMAIAGGGIGTGGVTAAGIVLVFAGAACFMIWALTRKQQVVFATHSGNISVESKGLSTDVIERLLTVTEAARQRRLSELYGTAANLNVADPEAEPHAPRVEVVE